MQYALFTDNLADLSLPQACRAARQAGFDALDLTLRPGGHVLPEHAEMGLAEACRAAESEGISIAMVSTAVTDRGSPHAEDIFAAAAHWGVRRVKLGYWPYRPFGSAARQLEAARRDLAEIARLGRRYDVLPCVHCHSGRLLAAGGPLLYLLVKDFSPREVGAYVDPMHMTIEGGLNAWEVSLDLLAPWIALVGVKNFRWLEAQRDPQGQLRYRWQYVPLADGQAPLPEFAGYLRALNYDGIISLHSEYKGETSFRRLTTDELLVQSRGDLAYFKGLMRG